MLDIKNFSDVCIAQSYSVVISLTYSYRLSILVINLITRKIAVVVFRVGLNDSDLLGRLLRVHLITCV